MEETRKTPTPAPTVPRTWRSLLTGRWHRSSWMVAAAVLLFLVFCNVPGQLVTLPNDQTGTAWGEAHHFQHGWPWIWSIRFFEDLLAGGNSIDDLKNECWSFWAAESEFTWSALACNLAVAIVLTMFGGGAFELWRRARLRVWQIHLRELLFVLFLISMAGGWYAAVQRRYAQELHVIGRTPGEGHAASSPDRGITWYATTTAGPTWLRRLVGDRYFRFLDRVISIEVEPRGVALAAQLPDVGAVEVIGEVTGDELAKLGELPQLQYLALAAYSSPRLTLPKLPHVAEVKVNGYDCDGFTNLPSLRVIQWWNGPVDMKVIKRFSQVRQLQWLDLHYCTLLDDGLAQFNAHQELRHLSFNSMSLSKNCLEPMASLTRLTHVEFVQCKIDDRSQLRHLASLSHLEALILLDTNVDDDSLRHLIQLPNLRGLDLAGTDVSSAAITHLAQMKQLRELRLTTGTLDRRGILRLKAALPDCELQFLPTQNALQLAPLLQAKPLEQ